MRMRWKAAGAAVLALGGIVGTTGGAEAVQGCGPGWYRDFWGACRPGAAVQSYYGYYGGPRVVVAAPRYGYGYGGWYGPRWGWRRYW